MRAEIIEDIQTLGKASLPHLWKDEIRDVFILTKRMEFYAYSKTVLGCYCWSRKTYLQLQKTGVIFDVMETDDPLVYFRTERANLPLLLSLGAFKRRPHRNGKRIKSLEKRLGHKILPFKFTGINRRILKKTTGESGLFETCKTHKSLKKELECT